MKSRRTMFGRGAYLLFVAALASLGFTHGRLPTYRCEIISCAEAYSVTRALTGSYNGFLFRLTRVSDLATLDVGQSNHVADMSTWSAFCGGVQSNCVYGKIYAQINTGSNDLIPSTIFAGSNGRPDCTGGTAIKCAAPFTIEAATGLPIIITTTGQEYNIGATDVASVGINAGSNTMAIFYNGKNVIANFCCGVFGLAHKYNAGNTPGTDFMVTPFYQWPGPGAPNNPQQICSINGIFCWGIDDEATPDNFGDLPSGSAIINIAGTIQLDAPNNQTRGDVNGHHIFTVTPVQAFNAGKFIHLGGGGDLTQPGDAVMREGIISNNGISSSQLTFLLIQVRRDYPGLDFP